MRRALRTSNGPWGSNREERNCTEEEEVKGDYIDWCCDMNVHEVDSWKCSLEQFS